MFYDLMQEFWRSLLTLPDLHTDYLTTISAVMLVFVLLTLFLGLFCRANLAPVLSIVLVTLSIFFVTDHYFDRKTESEIAIQESITTGGESAEEGA